MGISWSSWNLSAWLSEWFPKKGYKLTMGAGLHMHLQTWFLYLEIKSNKHEMQLVVATSSAAYQRTVLRGSLSACLLTGST